MGRSPNRGRISRSRRDQTYLACRSLRPSFQWVCQRWATARKLCSTRSLYACFARFRSVMGSEPLASTVRAC